MAMIDAIARKARTELKKAKREQRERELAAWIKALPEKRYGVILADPGWRFEPYSRETGMDRAADNHYATSTLEQIKAIDVGSIAAKHCVLYLWATVPMGKAAHAVMEAWGFSYKSQHAWDKEIPGPGHWNRNQHELLLIGARGSEYCIVDQHELLLIGTRGKVPCPAMGTQWPSLVRERKRGHSVKPEWIFQMIETHFPNVPKIELFARRARPNWDCWGAEASPTAEAAE
jgi:N6-adenosine-specific RNA methylase IME4